MLSDLKEKKETFFNFFPKGLIQAIDQKMPNSSLFRFSQKTRNNA